MGPWSGLGRPGHSTTQLWGTRGCLLDGVQFPQGKCVLFSFEAHTLDVYGDTKGEKVPYRSPL